MGIGLFDARQPQGLIHRGVGLPVARNARGLCAVTHLAGVLQPTPAHMLDEATVDLFWRAAAFTPVEDELSSHRFRKNNVDVCLRKNIERVLAGCPVAIKGRPCADLKGVCARLLRFLPLGVSPPGENVLPKLGFSLASVGKYKSCLGTLDKRSGNTVIEHQQLN